MSINHSFQLWLTALISQNLYMHGKYCSYHCLGHARKFEKRAQINSWLNIYSSQLLQIIYPSKTKLTYSDSVQLSAHRKNQQLFLCDNSQSSKNFNSSAGIQRPVGGSNCCCNCCRFVNTLFNCSLLTVQLHKWYVVLLLLL